MKSEHRRLAALMQCIASMLEDLRRRRSRLDPSLYRAMLDYLEDFLYRYHHPKEDRYLFRVLRERRPDLRPTLDALQLEHARGVELLGSIRRRLQRCEAGRDGFETLAEAIGRYQEFERRHMRREEKEVLPVAEEALSESDWQQLDATFTDHDDPLFGDEPSEHFRRLFTEIAARTPAPHGFGAPAPPP